MKICIVTPYSPKMVGGVGRVVIDLCNGLRKRDIDCLIITKKIEKDLDIEEKLIEIPLINFRLLGPILFYLMMIGQIFRYRKEIDILNLQTPFKISMISGFVGKILGKPVITTIHGAPPDFTGKGRKYQVSFVERLTIALSDAVVSVDKRGVIDYNLKNAIVIENGIDTIKFQFNEKLRRDMRDKLKINDKFVLLFLGRWVPHKGIYELIEALTNLKQQGKKVVMILIGPCDDDKVLNKLNEDEVKDLIIPIGVVDSTLEYFCASDAFVLPSWAEGLPISMLEAMACRLPPLASEVGGIPYVIENFKDGLLVKPRDVKDLTDKINWCIENPERLKEIGENTERKAKEMYSLTRMTEDYINTFYKLTGKN